MLLIERYRGWKSSDDSGINISYFLYLNIRYHMISPHHDWLDFRTSVIRLNPDGGIGNNWVNEDGGVLRYLHGLCFRFK